MNRDLDLTRELLLHVEAGHNGHDSFKVRLDSFPGYDPKAVYGHLEMVTDEGLLKPHRQMSGMVPYTYGLTWAGHDFLDSVRDPEIWRRTKAAGEKARGWTVSLLADFAKDLIKIQLNEILRGAAG